MSDAQTAQEQAAAVWTRSAASYGTIGPAYFAHFGERLVQLAGIRPGESVLDAATGRGAVLFPAVERVGTEGSVKAVDFSPGMVEETRRDIEAHHLRNARVEQMDAQHLRFGDRTFDKVFCAFALFFFADRNRALSEFKRLLKPGGTLGVSTWGQSDPRWDWLNELHGANEATDHSPTSPRFDDPTWLTQLMTAAGFENVRVSEETLDVLFASADEWWEAQWTHGSRRHLEGLNSSQLEAARRFAAAKITVFKQPEGVPLRLHVLVTLAEKPKATT